MWRIWIGLGSWSIPYLGMDRLELGLGHRWGVIGFGYQIDCRLGSAVSCGVSTWDVPIWWEMRKEVWVSGSSHDDRGLRMIDGGG